MRKKQIIGSCLLGVVIAVVAITSYILNPADSQQFAMLEKSPVKTISLNEKKQAILKNDSLNAKAKRKLIAQLEGKLKAKTPYDKPKQAQQFYRRKRMNLNNEIPVENYIAASSQFANKVSLSNIIAPTTSPDSSKLYSAATDAHVWSNIGPGNVGGRTRAILVQGTNPNYTIYAGGVAGGIWKLEDSDSDNPWVALDDLMPNLAVTTLAQVPGVDDTIYAGTGEGFNNGDAVKGAGIFKTTDGGDTWEHLADTKSSDFYYVNKIVTSPNIANTVYAATRTGIWKSTDAGTSWTNVASGTYSLGPGYLDLAVVDNGGTDNLYAWNAFYGLQKSTNNGSTWPYSIGTDTYDEDLYRGSIAISASAPATAYVSVSNSDGRLTNVYKTTDYFANAAPIATLDASAAGKLNAVLLSNPAYSHDQGGGTTCVAGVASGGYGQGWYDNVIAVDPTDPNIVFVGGIDLFRSDDGGVTFNIASYWWANTANSYYNHADHHAITFAPDYDADVVPTIFFGNDGGIFKSANAHNGTTSTSVCSITDIGVSYESLNNGYGVTQFYHGSVSSSGTVYIAGSQDNGTQKFGSGTDWNEIRGGDGGYTAISPDNSDIMYSAYTNISIERSDDGGASFSTTVADSSNGFDDDGLFINPYAIIPDTPGTMYLTGYKLWRSTNVESASPTWTNLGSLGGNQGSAIGVPPKNYAVASSQNSDQTVQYAGLFSIGEHWNMWVAIAAFVFVLLLTFLMHIKTRAINSLARWGVVLTMCCAFSFLAGCASDSSSSSSRSSSLRIGTVYVGTEDGRFFASATSAMVERSTGLPAGYISSVTVHPTNHSIVYVTFSSFGRLHLWKTTDAGVSWTSLDGTDIPDIPAHSLFIDPNNTDHLYLGTDLGVLYSGDGGGNWETINTEGMANVVVEHLVYQHSTRSLFAFTHGRGVFQVTLP